MTPQLIQPSPKCHVDKHADLIKENKHYQDLYRECLEKYNALKGDMHLEQFRQSAAEKWEDEVRTLRRQLLQARGEQKQLETETRLTQEQAFKELDVKDEQLSKAVNENLKLEATKTQLLTKIQAIQSENSRLDGQFSEALAVKDGFEIENSKLQTDNDLLSKQLSELRGSTDSDPFAQRLAFISAEKSELEKQFTGLKSNLEATIAGKDQIFRENERLKDTIFEMDNTESHLQNELSQFKKGSRLENDRLQQAMAEFKRKCSHYEAYIKDLEYQKSENSPLIDSLEEQKHLLTQDLERLRQTKEQLNRELNERCYHLEKTVEDTRRKNTELRSQINNRRNSHLFMKEQCTKYEAEIEALGEKVRVGTLSENNTNDELSRIQTQLNKEIDLRSESQKKIQSMAKKNAELLSENQRIKAVHAKELDQYKSKSKRLQVLEDQLKSVQKERDCERGKHEQLRHHYGQMAKDKTELISQIRNMKHISDELTQKIENLSAILAEQTQATRDLSKTLAEKEQEVGNLKRSSDMAVIDAAHKTAEAEDLTSQLKESQKVQGQLEKRILDCIQEVFKHKALRLAHTGWIQAHRRFGSRAEFHGDYCDRWGEVYVQGRDDELIAALQRGMTVNEALGAVENTTSAQEQNEG